MDSYIQRYIGIEPSHSLLVRYGLVVVVICILVVTAYRLLIIAIRKLFLPHALHRLNRHALDLAERFENSGEPSDLSEAISTMQAVIELTPAGHPSLPGRLINLGNWFDTRYDRTRDLGDLNESIAAQQSVVLLTPESDINFPAMLHNLGITFNTRFERSRDISDLTEAIAAKQISVRVTPESHPFLPSRLNSLASSFNSRFDITGNIPDSDEAVSVMRRVVELVQNNEERLPTYLNALGNAYDHRFNRTEDISDIDEAITSKQKAVDLASDEHPDLIGFLSSLAISFLHRFGMTDDLCDNTNSIAALERSVSLAAEDDHRLPRMLSQLGCAYQTLFDRCLGEMPMIDKAISVQQKSLELSSECCADLLYNLGTSFRSRFARSGDISDITEAVAHLRRSLEVIADVDDFLPQVLSNLGISLHDRFHHTGHSPDVDEAISLQQRAIGIRVDGHPDLPLLLSNLGSSLQSRFSVTQDRSDIDEAISVNQQAANLTPGDHAALPGRLSNLAISLNARFRVEEDVSDIDNSISTYQKAVKLMPKRHAFLPHLYNNLGIAFTSKFNVFGDITNVDEAILVGQLAVDLTPEGHANMPHGLINLGNSFYLRSLFPDHAEDFDLCLSHYRKAATSGIGFPRSRLQAAKLWAQILAGCCPESPDIIPAFDTAIYLLTLVGGLEQTVRRRYTQIEGISSLTLEAAAEAFRLGKPEKALEWLEQGRCMVWNQMHSLRTPLDELSTDDPELAQQLSSVAQQLDIASSSKPPSEADMSLSNKVSMEDKARAHIALAKEWERLLGKVRGKSNFQDFLNPPRFSALLRNLPPSGYVIVINMSEARCDAIALSHALPEPLHIPLPNFSSRKANRCLVDLKATLERRQREAQVDSIITGRPGDAGQQDDGVDRDMVRKMHQILWKWLVKPILDVLKISKFDAPSSPSEMPPRIWWCPTGDLSFLPIHAAGIYRKRNSESILDYTVSSYIPTVTTLTSRVQNERTLDECVPGVFLTSQPKAGDAKEIPMTTVEVDSIHSLAMEKGVKVLKLDGDELSIDKCLECMEAFGSVHLACHASKSAAHPLERHFLFHQGSLDLGTIIQRNLKNADFAYLSACHTGAGEEKLSEEAVHLGAGMLAAGYRRVVATMWSVGDKQSLQVTKDFYEYLWGRGESDDMGKLDGKRSAYAFHYAIQQLRGRSNLSEGAMLAIASYIHFGY